MQPLATICGRLLSSLVLEKDVSLRRKTQGASRETISFLIFQVGYSS